MKGEVAIHQTSILITILSHVNGQISNISNILCDSRITHQVEKNPAHSIQSQRTVV